jgi:hypothetical protein
VCGGVGGGGGSRVAREQGEQVHMSAGMIRVHLDLLAAAALRLLAQV